MQGLFFILSVKRRLFMQLVLATRNANKLEEIRDVLGLNPHTVKSSFDYPQIPDVVEDKDTLEGNAIKKATTIAAATGCWALADDSGLEVDALAGAPGVYSARYAGEHCSYLDNCNKLLFEMEGKTNRRARFRTVLALVNLVGEVRTLEGAMEGTILTEMRGEGGFGYDPVFMPEGYDLSYAEFDPAEKNRISHRGKALHAAIEQWGALFAQI
jgi:XTP/dITP diphosphohydrolase